jgi:hypothetical protein
MADSESNRANEIATIKKVQADVGALLKPFQALMKIKAGKGGDVEQLQMALEQLPPKETIEAVVDDVRQRGADVVRAVGAARGTEFRKIEAAYINKERDAGEAIRELNSGWRLGALELEVDRERSRARLLFSKEVVVPWSAIGSIDDLQSLVVEGRKKLKSAEMTDASLIRTFWDAYVYLRATKKGAAGKPPRVSLRDFYREVRVAWIRDELLDQKRPAKKIARTDLPSWAFLYNLSRYYQLREAVPASQRLALETGSQQDYAKGLGMIITPLDSTQDQKTYCYVFDASSEA